MTRKLNDAGILLHVKYTIMTASSEDKAVEGVIRLYRGGAAGLMCQQLNHTVRGACYTFFCTGENERLLTAAPCQHVNLGRTTLRAILSVVDAGVNDEETCTKHERIPTWIALGGSNRCDNNNQMTVAACCAGRSAAAIAAAAAHTATQLVHTCNTTA